MPRPGKARQSLGNSVALDQALQASREYFFKNPTHVCFVRDTIQHEFKTVGLQQIRAAHTFVCRVKGGGYVRFPLHPLEQTDVEALIENIRVTLKFGGSAFLRPDTGKFLAYQSQKPCPPGFVQIEAQVRGQA
jgi:hypothetical protein